MKPDKKKDENAENKTTGKQNSKGQNTDPETAGTGAANKEPTLRSYTTDSSRVHKNSHDDMTTGGNIR
ncbi:hypothetical protein H8S95_09605 [Pontibacter sp. KCTC 32443]|uniref:hypothetical protein n=1 Tax=Pontibacter TaxID=323449 RepID=UPI00164E6C84|nr:MULTISPECIES: hypothetical protein [Pontibacter]MBC5774315.1 hypothetical protein [Pontibacter sp. KCTC 32443]